MRFGAGLKWLGVGAFVLCVSGSATAQPNGGGGATGGGGGAAAGGNLQLGFEKKQQLTPQEAAGQASTILARLDQAAAAVRHQLDSARQQRDIVKSLCLSDKLSQIDAAARSCRDRNAALQAAVQRNDVELSNHEFTIMSVLGQRGNQLIAESNQCIGQDMSFVGQTEVTTEVSSSVPNDDGMGNDYVIVPPPPIVVSPVK
jgi:hypothetical protein